ncbi:MAG: MFS transporter [Lentisphaeria bacterium]|nr:MFS transporter [Lentisphaeria bacterium]
MKLKESFKPNSGAGAFFFSILLWGIGVGCFAAAMNNFLADIYHMNSVERGWLEFFRELPGLALVFLLALLHKVSDWKIIRLGTMISMAGAALLLLPANKIAVVAVIMIWSLGEHLVMPIRSAVAMQVAKANCEGRSLGLLSSVMNFGAVAGSLLVALIFYIGTVYLDQSEELLFNALWILIIVLMLASTVSTFTARIREQPSKRPRLYFHKKFNKYYALELFYGARKQIFLTFAPYVLIKEYGFSTAAMAFLLGVCAFINIFAAPAIGRLTDKWGCRNIMIYDTVVLFFVCLAYGFAGRIWAMQTAFYVVCLNFVLDAIISTTSMAANIYVKSLADDSDELTSTLSTGISINHLIAIITAPLGGWIWVTFGVEYLFSFAAAMSVGNTLFAMTIPKTNLLCSDKN